MKKQKFDLTVVAPCFNEESNLKTLCKRLINTFKKRNIHGQIVLVNDCSTDNTGAVINDLVKSEPEIIKGVHHEYNQGLSAGWDTGIKNADGQYVCFIDADLQNPPEEVGKLYRELIFSNVDMVQGSRSTIGRLKDSRYILSRGLNILLNLLFDMHAKDNKSGFVIASKNVMQQVLYRRKDYKFFHTFITISARSKGFSIKEVETLFQNRNAGQSFIPKLPLKLIKDVLVDLYKGFIEFRISPDTKDHLDEFLNKNPCQAKHHYTGFRKFLLDLYFATSPLHKWMITSRSKKMYLSLKQTEWLSKEKIKELQEFKLQRLINHCYQHVPYYREIFDQNSIQPDEIKSIEDLTQLPMINKSDVRENLYFDLFADNHVKNDLYKISTSGSTGEPFVTFADRMQLEMRFATTLRALEWTGWNFGDKQARLWHQTIGMSITQIIREKVDAWFMKRLFVPAYEMKDSNLKSFVKKIARHNPVLVDGYAESFNFLAQYINKNEIPGFKPKAIMTSAQVMPEQVRKIIEEKFTCKVFDKYGSREFSGIAYECDHQNGHHIMAESYIVEIIKDGRPAKPGEIGEVLITDLNNYSVPLIRYRIGDLATAVDNNNTCSCGRGLPLIGKIEGRSQAIVVGTNNTWIPGTFFAHYFKEYDYAVRQYQIVQEKLNEIDLKIIKGEQFNTIEMNKIVEGLMKFLGEAMKINVVYVDEIPLVKTGKRTAIISKLNLDFQNLNGLEFNESKEEDFASHT